MGQNSSPTIIFLAGLITLPAEGALGIVRLYLPAQNEPVQLDWAELQSGQDKRRWDF